MARRGHGTTTTHVIAETRSGVTTHVVHTRGPEVAGRCLRRARGERSEIGKALGSSEVVGNAVSIRASRQLKSGALATDDMGIVAAGSPRLTIRSKVEGGGTAEATLVHVEAGSRLSVNVSSGGRLLALEHSKLSGLGLSHRLMLKTHVVGKDVNRSAVLRGDTGREDQNFTRVITAEHNQLSVELEGLGIIQIDISRHGN